MDEVKIVAFFPEGSAVPPGMALGLNRGRIDYAPFRNILELLSAQYVEKTFA